MKNDIRINVKDLHPRLRFLLQKLVELSNAQGVYLIVTEGFRTAKKQDELYAQGRTKPGKIVTNAKGNSYQSQHQWGIAFDIAIANPGHTWDVAYIRKVADIAKKHCNHLGWGGDWTKEEDGIVDNPHFYLDIWGKNPSPLKEKYKTPEAFMKTWVGKVSTIRKRGLYLWDSYKKGKKKILQMPKNSTVRILKRGKKWATVEYKDTVGYARNRYIK